jgi:hypothetical protein
LFTGNAVGFAIWLFGYLTAGHAPLFDWNATTPWWISSFIPSLEAEIGLALMFASILPTLPWPRFPRRALSSLGGYNPRVVGVFGVADLERDLGTVARGLRKRWEGLQIEGRWLVEPARSLRRLPTATNPKIL